MTEKPKDGVHTGSGAHEFGADNASAYVPPQVVKPKAKPRVDEPKVQIKKGLDPRRSKTMPRLGNVLGPGASATPFQASPGAPPGHVDPTTPAAGNAVSDEPLPFAAASPQQASPAPPPSQKPKRIYQS